MDHQPSRPPDNDLQPQRSGSHDRHRVLDAEVFG